MVYSYIILDSLGPILPTVFPADQPVGNPALIVKQTVMYLVQSLNSHMRDLLFSNNNDELKALF
jgi:hypothetical protein